MNAIATGALYAWPFVVVLVFLVLSPRRAVIASMIFGWLFLPEGVIEISGFPEYSKVTATSIGVLLGTIITDVTKLLGIRWRVWDLPMLVWCVTPMMSSLTNGLGLWDGLSGIASHLFLWGIPYVIGRGYFHSAAELRDLALGIFIGGLVYAPLCIWEIRMGPNLHHRLYGFRTSPFVNHIRFDGYRPNVFLHSGLPVGVWMSAACICGITLAMSRAQRLFLGVPVWLVVAGLCFVAFIGKALGALVLLFGCVAVLVLSRMSRTKFLAMLLVLSPALYVLVRIPGVWEGEPFISWAGMLDADRAKSLAGRLEQENMLVEKALRQPLFGWGGWGRYRVRDDFGNDISVTDGFWVIAMGQFGFSGLLAAMGFQVIPGLLAAAKQRAKSFATGRDWPAAALMFTLFIYAADNLLNAMPNPVFMVSAGALVSAAIGHAKRRGGRRPIGARAA